MIHRVGQRKVPWPAAIATVGYLLLILALLGAASPYSATARRMEASVVSQIWAHGKPTVTGMVSVPVPLPQTPTTRYQTQACWRTNWFGEQVQRAYVHQKPRYDLPRSTYRLADWDPITDDITWEPFLAPGLGYYTGTVHACDTLAELTTALGAAVDTDIIEIDAASTIVINAVQTLANRGDSGWVLMRTSDTSWLTSTAADRVSESDTSHMPTLRVENSNSGLRAAQAARGWDFRGLYFTKTASTSSSVNATLGAIQFKAATQTELSHMPTYLNIDKCLFVNPYTTGTPSYWRRAVLFGGEFQLMRRSMVVKFTEDGTDSQALWINHGVGKILVEDCSLEATSEVIMSGGATQSMGAAATCADYCVRFTRLWRGTDLMTGSDITGEQKNFAETKHGNRILYDGIYADGFLGTGQQFDWNWGAKPQSSAEQAFVILQNLTQRYCQANNSAGPAQILCSPSDSGFSTALNGVQRIEIYHLLQTNNAFASSSNRWQVGVGCVTNVRHITFLTIHNTTTAVQTGGVMFFGQSATNRPDTMANFGYFDNINYGASSTTLGPLYGNGTTDSLTVLNSACGSGLWTCQYNVQWRRAWGATLTNTPNFNATAASLAAIGFVDEANDNYELDPGSAYKGLSTVPGNDPGVYWDGLQARLAGIGS